MLNRTATLADVSKVAAFVASDQARTMTAADVKILSGGIMELDAWICDLEASPLPLFT